MNRRAAHRRRGRRIGRLLALCLLLAMLGLPAAAVAGGVWFDRTLQHVAALPDYPDRPPAGSGTTWLMVGSDTRQGLDADQQQQLATGGDIGDGRADTVLLIHLPGLGSRAPATVVSIPRDSYLPIPGYGRDKINAAFALGGPALLSQTVQQATGMRLDHYAEIGFGGFAAVVDALGGIRICPDEPIRDPLAGLDLPAGCHHLDGPAALGYVRSRDTPRADLDRMVHQRLFVSALLQRATSPSVWLDPRRWYRVPRVTARAVTVDEDAHLPELARLGWALHGSTVNLTVPIGEFTGSDSGAVVIWDHDAAGRLFDALAHDTPIPADTAGEQP